MISNKPNILYIIHDYTSSTGGTSLHLNDLINGLKDEYNFHTLTLDGSTYKVYSYIEGNKYETIYPRLLFNATFSIYKDKDYKEMIEEIIDDFKISFVHIEHMYGGHFFDIYDVLKKKNIKYAITLHDFYVMCPLVNKLYLGKEYCGYKPSFNKCEECTKKAIDKSFDMKKWRDNNEKLLKGASIVIAPSLAVKKEIEEIYPSIDISVIEHGSNLVKRKSTLKLDKVNDIAFIGFIMARKGSAVLKYLVDNNSGKYRMHLFGFTDAIILEKRNYINHGTYKRDNIVDLLRNNNIKLVCLLSICPETYSYTLNEAIAAGIPVISYNIGSLAFRVGNNNLGWLIDIKSSKKEVINKIEEILTDEDEYNKKIDAINKFHIRTVEEMVSDYRKLYKNLAISSLLDTTYIDELSNDSHKYKKVKTIYDNRYLNAGISRIFLKLPTKTKEIIINKRKNKMIKKFKLKA